MDGVFYNDLREPFFVSDLPAVTLATTAKALYTPSSFPPLGQHYFARPGKKLRIRIFGKMTTAATPGNLVIDIYYGDGTDANGVLLASITATALSASQTNLSWQLDLLVRCITTGSAGTLYAVGMLDANVGLIASTLQPVMLPASAAAVSAACDLTLAKIISVQARRSGSTAETMTVQDMDVIGMN